jgi:hypothetical protein
MNNLSINFVTPKDQRREKLLFVFWNDYFCKKQKYSYDFSYANDLMHMTQMIANSMLYHNYDRILCYNLEEALELAAASNFKNVVVHSPGSIINKNHNNFVLDYIKNKDYFIAGHILDGRPKNKYLHLHEQCFVVNLDHFNNFDHKLDFTCNQEKTFQDYYRSTENFHDDYTPLWVKGLNTTLTTKNYDWSASWLDYGLKTNTLYMFIEGIRGNKFHMYPETPKHRETWYGSINEENQLSRILDSACKIDTQQHIFNNENFSKSSAYTVKDNIDTLIVPASGFFSVHAFKHFKPKKIIYYDIDTKTLNLRKIINDHWNAITPIRDIFVDGINPFQDIEIPQIQLIDNDWIKSQDEAEVVWKEFQLVEKEYHCIDIIHNYDQLLSIVPDSNTFIWLNSIYTYSINIWNHRPSKIFESYYNFVYGLKKKQSKIWVDVKEPTGQYRCFEVHGYVPDAVMMGYANYTRFL